MFPPKFPIFPILGKIWYFSQDFTIKTFKINSNLTKHFLRFLLVSIEVKNHEKIFLVYINHKKRGRRHKIFTFTCCVPSQHNGIFEWKNTVYVLCLKSIMRSAFYSISPKIFLISIWYL